MDTEVIAAKAAPAAGEQTPPEVSTPETTDPKASEEEATPPVAEAKEDAPKEGDEPKEEKVEEATPFHKIPAFQRLARNAKRSEALVNRQSEQIKELTGLVKKMLSVQEGTEYVPEAPAADAVDYEAMIDSEMSVLSDKEGLTPSEEQAVIEIAMENAIVSGDERVPLPLENALKIYRKYQAAQKQSEPKKEELAKKAETPKPKPEVKEEAEPMYVPRMSRADIIAEAKAKIAAQNGK